MNRILAFFKKETVLCAALILAVVSMFFVPPDKDYLGYVDLRTLAILFSLMCVMAGLQKIGVFDRIARKLLSHVRSGRSLILTLALLCFFSSMFITNDVALITFVPFTFTILDMLGEERKHRLLLPVVVMQTIAANLGSMLTPIGNPQNLYLYGKAGLSIPEFLLLMLPYTLLALALLVAWSLIQGRICPQVPKLSEAGRPQTGYFDPHPLAVYFALFLLCLLAVAHVIPWQAAFFAVIVMVFLTDRQVFQKVDYSLLLTFTGFFVFVGNVGRISAFRDFLQDMIAGREVYTAIAASQVISNVPAALLLSGFTEDLKGLIVGTNLGGLGTLIASMASLISYKYIAKGTSGRKGEYIALFTAGNVVFLGAMMALHALL
ncbi:MAG: SLC13 family permease [Lachnospiraceae bacterium]|nr:SLC13 family permease [Lachnospiraceae bacterium]MCM1239771.1 SLC13 family permease [Lachnospiraceae bacterium]